MITSSREGVANALDYLDRVRRWTLGPHSCSVFTFLRVEGSYATRVVIARVRRKKGESLAAMLVRACELHQERVKSGWQLERARPDACSGCGGTNRLLSRVHGVPFLLCRECREGLR